jgi:LEA14-like dessication related protein
MRASPFYHLLNYRGTLYKVRAPSSKKVVDMGFIKKLVALVVLLIFLWGAYVAYALMTATPQFRAEWGNVSEGETQIIISGNWSKPLLIPVSVRYVEVNFSGIEIARTEEFSYSPLGTGMKTVVSVKNGNVVRALFKYLDNGQRGELGVAFRGFLMVFIPLKFSKVDELNEDILDQVKLSASSQPLLGGLLQSPALLGTKLEWKGERDNNGIMVAYMDLYNPNDFPMPIGNLRFTVYANGVEIGAGHTEKSVIIPAKGHAVLPVETTIYGDELPKAWALHVKNGEESRIKVNLYLTVTAMGKSIDVKLMSQEETIKTDIMENINQVLEEVSTELRRG